MRGTSGAALGDKVELRVGDVQLTDLRPANEAFHSKPRHTVAQRTEIQVSWVLPVPVGQSSCKAGSGREDESSPCQDQTELAGICEASWWRRECMSEGQPFACPSTRATSRARRRNSAVRVILPRLWSLWRCCSEQLPPLIRNRSFIQQLISSHLRENV